jgi:hypothetical protein
MENLSQVEKAVLDVIQKGMVSSADTQKIAEICKISNLQAAVAVQLLQHKKLIVGSTAPTDSWLTVETQKSPNE